MTFDSDRPRDHLDEGEIAAYIDGAMTEDERRSAEAHLAGCDECRIDTIASQDAVTSAPAPGIVRSRRYLPWIGLAAAAAIMVVAVSTLSRTTSNGTTERGSAIRFPDMQRVVSIVNPADGAILGSDRRLVWRSSANGATYRITIGDDSGQPAHSATLSDTSFVIPQSISLTSGRKYFWYVDAMTSEGTTATSGLNSFTID